MCTHIFHFLIISICVILFVTICQSVSVDKSFNSSRRRSERSPSSPSIPSFPLFIPTLQSSYNASSSFPLPSSPSSSSSSSSSIVNEMQASKPLEPPRIIEHPSDIVVKNNEPAMLYCKADGQPKPTIEWFKDGEKVKPGRPRIFISGDGLFFYKVVSGEGKDSDTGIYWCIARNQIGKVVSRNATVNVGYLRDDFRMIPKSGTVIAGDSVTLDCSPPRGSPEPSVTWKKDGEPMMTLMASPRFQLTTSGSLKINDIHPTDRGIYVCEASNSVGSRESPPASLVVLVRPYFIKIPNNLTIPEMGTVEFECKVDGDPVPQITWTKKDGKLPSARSTIKPDKTLRLVNVSLEDEGVYICEAGNHVASAIAYATLTIANGLSGGGGIESAPALYHSIAKEPYFIVGAILLMFILCSIIMIIFARQHLGWKKAVGAYITVQLSKADELEKARHLNNTCSSKNSWLLETTTSPPTGATVNSPGTTTGLLMSGSGSKGFISSELRKGSSYLHHSSPTPPPPPSSNSSSIRIASSLIRDCDNTKGGNGGGGYRQGGFGQIKSFNPSHHHYHDHLTTNTSTNLQSYPAVEEGYYAEVEGYSSLVTFGKKDSLTATTTNTTETNSTPTSTSTTTVPGNIVNQNNILNNTKSISPSKSTTKATIIEPMAPSIEPYATTNLINTYHPQQYLEHRACDQNNYQQQQQSVNYYGLPLTVSINGSSGNVVNSPSLSHRYPIYHQLHHTNNPEHINNYNHSPLSSSNRSTITNTSNTSTTSTPTIGSGGGGGSGGLGYRKVILKDSRSKDRHQHKSNRAVLITDDLYAIPNCGTDDLDDDDDDLDQHIRPPSANFFLPNT